MKKLNIGDNCIDIDLDVMNESKKIDTDIDSMIYIRTHASNGLTDGFLVHNGSDDTMRDALSILLTQDKDMLDYSLDVLIEFFKEDEVKLDAFRVFLKEVGV